MKQDTKDWNNAYNLMVFAVKQAHGMDDTGLDILDDCASSILQSVIDHSAERLTEDSKFLITSLLNTARNTRFYDEEYGKDYITSLEAHL